MLNICPKYREAPAFRGMSVTRSSSPDAKSVDKAMVPAKRTADDFCVTVTLPGVRT
jgi:hypothetical protein